jgi:hypothetical protein
MPRPPTIQKPREQLDIMAEACGTLPMFRAGYRVVITHGNGPAVGNILFPWRLPRSSWCDADGRVRRALAGRHRFAATEQPNVLARRGATRRSSIVTEGGAAPGAHTNQAKRSGGSSARRTRRIGAEPAGFHRGLGTRLAPSSLPR